jgi:hypothetical protein
MQTTYSPKKTPASHRTSWGEDVLSHGGDNSKSVTPIYSPARRQSWAFVQAVTLGHGIRLLFQGAKHLALQPSGLRSLVGFLTAAPRAGIRPKGIRLAALSQAFWPVGIAFPLPNQLRVVFS